MHDKKRQPSSEVASFKHDNIMFIYAHMDDETINSYGTIRRLAECGKRITIFCLCGNGRAAVDQSDRKHAFDNMFSSEKITTMRYVFDDMSLKEDEARSCIECMVEKIKP